MMRTAALAALLLGACGAAHGQSVEELKRAIAERDAVILELKRKLDALERSQAPRASPAPAARAAPSADDDEELSRALERTLVQQGGLLLRPGAYELQPEASYANWDPARGAARYVAGAALSLRAGLPWESQFQLRVPYVHVATAAGSATALGDIDLSFSRQLARESARSPGLIASLGWTTRTGRDGFGGGVATGGGFNVPQAALTAVKRSDPLMLYGGVSYAVPLSRQVAGVEIAPGNTFGLRLGTILAASPDTAVNLGLNLGFPRVTRLNGQAVGGSDTVFGTLQVGVGTVLSRSALLNVAGDFRVTGNVPNFRLSVSLPIRF
jgi:hypothetical protein